MFLIGFYPALLTYVPLRKIVVFKSSSISDRLKKHHLNRNAKDTIKYNPNDWLPVIHDHTENLSGL